MGEVEFFVFGFPLPKGSGSAMFRGGRPSGFMEMADKKTKKRPAGGLRRWQSAVRERARNEIVSPIQGPVTLEIEFHLERPRKPKFIYPASKPDLDKLARSVFDALSGIAYEDDSRVVQLVASKRYACEGKTGAHVRVIAFGPDAC